MFLNLLQVGVIMTFVAKGRHRLRYQLGILRGMSAVAGTAIAIRDRLMHDLRRSDLLLEVFVTFKT